MKTTIQCRAVFDLLTKPTRLSLEESSRLAEHAQQCSGCRQLTAEVAAASELVRSVSAELSVDAEPRVAAIMDRVRHTELNQKMLPGDHRLVATGILATAEHTAPELPSTSFSRPGWWSTACLAVTLLIVCGIGFTMLPANSDPVPSDLTQARLVLASLGTPDSCLSEMGFTAGAMTSEPPAEDQALTCCTACHAAGESLGWSAVQRDTLARSCMVCHPADG